ncbi:MAG: M3 family metallopeptidase [Candidatus Krumholzibacteriota bacterium]|nr:M3 family metallopeptidase [Candidatus Krumholzibacteriota bacterium]
MRNATKALLLVLATGVLFISCVEKAPGTMQEGNPLLAEFDTPFGVPPFDRIEEAHYPPAFEAGMAAQRDAIALIANDTAAPTFENTIEALERSGELLSRVENIFFALNSANTSPRMQEIAREAAPLLSDHRDNISLDAKLFERVKAVYDMRGTLDLDPEQHRLLEEYYKNFVRSGAALEDEQKAELREINKELAVLSLQYGENVLKENNAFELVIDDEADLSGLPDAVVTAAAEAAAERGHENCWVFTLHKPSMIPFLQYSDRRELREKIYRAYTMRGNNDDEFDNKKNAARIAALRVRKANLLGFDSWAAFILDERMAKTPERVHEFLDGLWWPALARAKDERAMMQQLVYDEGHDFKLASWDWWYYAEKLKKAKYDLDETMLKPYFELENVLQGVFHLAGNLYGLQFEERKDIPVYHEDVRVFEVKEADGSHIGILYTDYFPRESKRGGAWSGAIRKQQRMDGEVTPIVTNVGNFSKPTADSPSLLSWDEVLTLFHEFGHGLHSLLSDCTYETLSGTAVAWDFVELPSQIMENFAGEPELLKVYARHYETGEPIPEELIGKIRKAKHFNQGFATTEYLAASLLDMDWHTMTEAVEVDPVAFETASLDRIGLIPEIVSRYRSTYFQHIFSGGYSAGYYSYIWAEVLDADAFQAFKETGDLYDRETARRFREFVLSKGGTEDPMVLYVKFRGAEPKNEPMLERRGLI